MPLEIRSSISKNSNPPKTVFQSLTRSETAFAKSFSAKLQYPSKHLSLVSQRRRLSDADSVIITKLRRIVPMTPSIVALGDTRKKLNKESPDVEDRNLEGGAKVANSHFMLLLSEMLVGLEQVLSRWWKNVPSSVI